MKQFFFLALFIIGFTVFAQSSKTFALLTRSTDSTQTFKATIAGQPATFFLEAKDVLDCKSYEYYVDGYYYYDKYKKKISLTGIYSGGDLYLYNFGSEKDKHRFKMEILPWLVPASDSLAKTLNVNEIIGFRFDHYSEKQKFPMEGYFEKNSKKQTAKLFTKNSSIYRNNEHLILPNGKEYLLTDLPMVAKESRLLSVGIAKNENRIVMSFDQPSNENFCGMCGAGGYEIGYQMLTFDKNWNFRKVDKYLTTSCLASMESLRLKSKNKNLLVYHVKESGGKIHRLAVNLDQSYITKEFLN